MKDRSDDPSHHKRPRLPRNQTTTVTQIPVQRLISDQAVCNGPRRPAERRHVLPPRHVVERLQWCQPRVRWTRASWRILVVSPCHVLIGARVSIDDVMLQAAVNTSTVLVVTVLWSGREMHHCSWTTLVHGRLLFMDDSCSWTTLVHGRLLFMDDTCSWTPLVHGRLLFMDDTCSWTPLVHGRLLFMDASCSWTTCSWTTPVHGRLLFMDASCSRTTLVHGRLLFMDASCSRTTLVHGRLLFMDDSCSWTTPVHRRLLFMWLVHCRASDTGTRSCSIISFRT